MIDPYEENDLSIMGNIYTYDQANTDIPYAKRMYAKGNDNVYYLSVKDILESSNIIF